MSAGDPEDYLVALYTLGRHVPGFGGPEALDNMAGHEVLWLLRRLEADLKREAAALKRGRRGTK